MIACKDPGVLEIPFNSKHRSTVTASDLQILEWQIAGASRADGSYLPVVFQGDEVLVTKSEDPRFNYAGKAGIVIDITTPRGSQDPAKFLYEVQSPNGLIMEVTRESLDLFGKLRVNEVLERNVRQALYL